MTTSSARETFAHVAHETEVDGGWSGQLRIVAGTNIEGQAQPLVSIDADLLGPRRLVLTLEEAEGLGFRRIAYRNVSSS